MKSEIMVSDEELILPSNEFDVYKAERNTRITITEDEIYENVGYDVTHNLVDPEKVQLEKNLNAINIFLIVVGLLSIAFMVSWLI